jgi:hypothetical protein
VISSLDTALPVQYNEFARKSSMGRRSIVLSDARKAVGSLVAPFAETIIGMRCTGVLQKQC